MTDKELSEFIKQIAMSWFNVWQTHNATHMANVKGVHNWYGRAPLPSVALICYACRGAKGQRDKAAQVSRCTYADAGYTNGLACFRCCCNCHCCSILLHDLNDMCRMLWPQRPRGQAYRATRMTLYMNWKHYDTLHDSCTV